MFHIIDDDELLRDLLTSMINSIGFPSLCFTSGEAYIEHLNSPDYQKPTAVLSDVMMAGMNGYALATMIRQAHPKLKIIIVTGNPDLNNEASKELCYTLNKPFQLRQLKAIIHGLDLCTQDTQSIKTCELISNYGCPHDCLNKA